jgi:hypothetical protein
VNSTDLARANEQLNRARDARDSLTLEAEIAEERLLELIQEVNRAEANYDHVIEALRSAQRKVGQWKSTLRWTHEGKPCYYFMVDWLTRY